tara:strand:+ start:1204 stop:1380 length:177 start_codon:yes stop_codon:yes gene_type:complete
MVLPKTFKNTTLKTNNYRKTDDDIYNDNDNDNYEENIFYGFLNNILEPFINICTSRPK